MTFRRTLMLAASSLAISTAGIAAAIAADEQYDVSQDPWFIDGQATLAGRLALTPNTNRARNVIIFIADGFGITAATVTRIYDGQLKGGDGEENFLPYERFPYNALIKTYATDSQIPDSSATASAIMTGVKTRNDRVNVSTNVGLNDCATMLAEGVPPSLGELAQRAGMATGVITTTYITDATPSTVYAHSPDRHWYMPSVMPKEAVAMGCKAITDQLVASGLSVALGGGRGSFLPENVADVEEPGKTGARKDGRDLTKEWQDNHPSGAYIWNADQLAALDLSQTDSLLGLFARGDIFAEDDDNSRDSGNPTLAEMTMAAIDVLSNDPDGYFLLVEEEGTDEFQHAGKVRKMADSALDLMAAIEATLARVSLNDTLIIVTSDHSQALAFAGWPVRGNPIFGTVTSRRPHTTQVGTAPAGDGKPYTAVGFYAGPGGVDGARLDLTGVATDDPDFIAPALVPQRGVPHGGEDVALYATGPWAHLFGGLIEQNVIFHIIEHAAGLSERAAEQE